VFGSNNVDKRAGKANLMNWKEYHWEFSVPFIEYAVRSHTKSVILPWSNNPYFIPVRRDGRRVRSNRPI